MYIFTNGSLSEIIYSSGVSGFEDFSSASAGREKRWRQRVVVMNCRRAMMLSGRVWERGGSR
jgi:hypothetical protein